VRARVGPVVSVRWGRSGGVRHVVKPLRGADARLSQLPPPPPSTDAKYTHHCTHCIIICNTHTHTHTYAYIIRTRIVYTVIIMWLLYNGKKNILFSLSSPIVLEEARFFVQMDGIGRKKRPLKIITTFDGYFIIIIFSF
jgi:hypothetical protein